MNQYRRPVSFTHLWLALLLLILASACASRGPHLTEAASRYRPERLASGTAANPGSIAWSPDNRMIAWTGMQPGIYTIESGKQVPLPVADARFLAWAPDGLLYILSGNGSGETHLSSLDARTSALTTLSAVDADGLYPLPGSRNLVLLSAAVKPLSIGTQINTRISLYSLASNKARTVYIQGRTAMSKNPDVPLLRAWLHAGLNPLDGSVLFLEHITPPLLSSYTVVHAVDLASGEAPSVPGGGQRKQYVSGSWSPDGKRLALTDRDGHLEIRGRSGDAALLDPSIIVFFPSWNPAGSRIYAGGFLIDSGGTNKEQLLSGGASSIAAWSPDGSMLAVSADGELLLFRGVRTSFIPPDTAPDKALIEKFGLLRDLYMDGSISRDEYTERRNSLLGRPEAAP